MAEFYTLEEAARVLGMSPDDLKTKAQGREVRGFLDGGSWQFRKADVEELARRSGLGSDAELRLSDLEVPAVGGDEFGDLDLSEFQIGVAPADLGAETMQFGAKPKAAAPEGSSEHDLMIDDLSVPPSPVTGSSSVIIGMSHLGKSPSDSDVRLVPESFKAASDSDVRLAPGGRVPSDSDVTLVKDDTSELGVFSASSSDTSVGSSPVAGSSAEVSSAAAISDFELAPSSELVDALQPESGSDFELSALDSSSDEFDTTPLKPSDSDVTAADPNLSGINLSRPSDSGINLLGAFGGGAESIELAPLSDAELPAKKAAPEKPKPSLAATPPPAVAKGEKDIFDDTDFEVDAALDDDSSDDRTVQLAAAGGDFDLEDSDSASEVFAIDEEDVDTNASTRMAPADLGSDEDEEDDGFDDAVSAEIGTAWASDDSPTAAAATPGVVISREASADWDGLAVGLLAFASVFVLLASMLAYDLASNLYDFHEGGVASGLVSSISGMLFG